MRFKTFLRNNFPSIRQECRRAALDACKDQYTDAILLLICMWADLLQQCGYDPSDWREFVSRFCTILRGESIFAFITKCSDFDDQLLHTLSRYDFYNEIATCSFSVPYVKYLRAYAEQQRDTSSSICQDGQFVQSLRSTLLFLKRLRGPSLIGKGLTAWLEINDYVGSHCRAPEPVDGFSREITFPRAQLTTGSVSDVDHTYGKQGLKAKASCTLRLTDWKTVTKYDLSWPPSVLYPKRRCIGDATATVLPVPKNFKTDRYITKEPAAQAWMQRRVALVLRDFVKSWTRGCCDPCDDSRNRWLTCQKGYATIDLTSASDTVHKDWINQIPWTELRRAVWATRSSLANVDDMAVEINMAAGMGCGWTFPLECYVFSTIASSICGDDYAVFGDDIVVPDEHYDSVVTLLEDYGFIPNQEKSYTEPYCFRESCGLHVFHWDHVVDASPVYYPGRFTTTGIRQSPENFINLQRESAYHGWDSVHYVISRQIAGKLPFSDYWESELPWSVTGNAQPDPVWGTYSLSTVKAKRYHVRDIDRYPFALLQDYISEECWDPVYPWIRKATFSHPEGWKRSCFGTHE